VARKAFASAHLPLANPSTQEKFGESCEKTLEQYMSCAQWYDIPFSLHRVLVHEEGAESKTKFARRFQQSHTRKTSQEDTMLDLFHRMMDISDPIVVAMSTQPKSMPEKHLPPDMAELLLTSEFDPSQDTSEPEESFSPVYS
jgi:hypothetical protein